MTFREKLDRHTIPESNTGCVLWTGCVDRDGYGITSDDGKKTRAHRAAYRIAKGDIPEKMQVCHKCDTPACVNPDHLFLGTNLDNYEDSLRKGRRARGQNVGRGKLTEEQVREILADTRRSGIIAQAYGVNKSQIKILKRGGAWKHITDAVRLPAFWNEVNLFGDQCVQAKITNEDVEDILFGEKNQRETAEEYGVAPATVSAIFQGTNWQKTVKLILGVG